ncbi:MAG TPA: adenylate/guanylate cyclase domain-containing protein [Gemmatimonadota bacterium]|nr:adenylate/guanylate cyclase domain-containing protein [Gemmatimonadota bacterium]
MDAVRIRTWSLRFEDPDLEAEFRDEYRHDSRWQVRLAIVVAVIVYSAFAWLDVWMAPDLAGVFLTIRILVAAVFGLALAVTFAPVGLTTREAFICVAILAAAAGILRMMDLATAVVSVRYFSGLLLFILAAHSMFRLRFQTAMLVSLLVVAAWMVQTGIQGGTPWWEYLNSQFFLVAAVILGMFASYSVERFARRGWLAQREAEVEHEKSERVLFNVLPEPIAERLKAEKGPIADAFPEATIMFVDLVDFTNLSSSLDPRRLVGLLNRLFTEFDRIVEEHGIEKIGTSGDSYMAVAGVPVPGEDHAERIADAALAMRDQIANREGDIEVQVRIGIATGPVVAGVIGEKKLYYDLWGNPVTIASRMQAHGLPGEIQVTEAVREALADRYEFEERGMIDVKGVGEMPTWLLVGKRGSIARADDPPGA